MLITHLAERCGNVGSDELALCCVGIGEEVFDDRKGGIFGDLRHSVIKIRDGCVGQCLMNKSWELHEWVDDAADGTLLHLQFAS